MINYSIIYTPTELKLKQDIIKYLCYDNKIHIRLRDFNKEEFLVGFEKKLSYLLSYLINYAYIPKLIGRHTDKEILEGFFESDDMVRLIDFLKLHYADEIEFKGLVIKPVYKKNQKNYKPFGNNDAKFFPDYIKSVSSELGELISFLNMLELQLYNYLFNDNYIIWVHEKDFTANKKFDNKKLKKLNKQNDKTSNIVELW